MKEQTKEGAVLPDEAEALLRRAEYVCIEVVNHGEFAVHNAAVLRNAIERYLSTPQPPPEAGSVPEGIGIDVVFARAKHWWAMKRPCGWSEVRHAIDPVVNCATDAEARLARAIANTIAAPAPKESS